MSAPVIWILVPIIAGLGLFFLRRWYRLTVSLGTGLSLLLALWAWQTPINEFISLGPWTLKIGDTFNILGRQFYLANPDRPLLAVIYILASVWFAAAYASRSGMMFVPLGLVITGLLTAVTAVDPFLYAALLLEMAALVSVVLFSRPGRPIQRGAIRFLIFQTLGMPFLLFTGYLLTGVEASPGELSLVSRAAILLAIGFILWLAVFPFHTWLPMVAEEAHPMSTGFVFLMLPFVVMLFGLGFLDRYIWLRDAPQLNSLLQLAGALMVLSGGIWAAFTRHLGRMIGFAVMFEIGKSILSLSLPDGLPLFFTMLLPRAIGLAVWCLSLTILQNAPGMSNRRGLRYQDINGLARKLPLATAGLSMAHFSIAGLPLLAGFPVVFALIRMLADTSLPIAILTLLGTAGLFAGGLRSLAAMVTGSDTGPQGWQIGERGAATFFLVAGLLALLLVGLFPQIFLPHMAALAQAFERLLPTP